MHQLKNPTVTCLLKVPMTGHALPQQILLLHIAFEVSCTGLLSNKYRLGMLWACYLHS